MRVINALALATLLLAIAGGTSLAQDKSAGATPSVAVGAQYDTAHVYVAPGDLERFSDSLIATFGGTKSQQAALTVTPTPSKTMWQAVFTPVGTFSVFGFTTPIPYPFGVERTGLPRDRHGYGNPIGEGQRSRRCRGAVQRSHWTRCHRPMAGRRIYAALLAHDRAELRETRQDPRKQGVRVTRSRRCFVRAFVGFSQGKIVSDDRNAPGIEVGRPKDTYRRVRIELHIREDRRARHRWTAPVSIWTRNERV